MCAMCGSDDMLCHHVWSKRYTFDGRDRIGTSYEGNSEDTLGCVVVMVVVDGELLER